MSDTGNSNRLSRVYLDALRIETRYLDAAVPDTTFTLFGQTFSSPIMTAALSHLDHFMFPGAARALAEGARGADAALWYGMAEEEEIQSLAGICPRMIEIIKPYRDREKIFRKIAHAEACGLLAVGVDIDHAFGPGGENDLVDGEEMAPMTTAELGEVCAASRLPVIVKGVLSRRDAERSLAAGAKGLVLSHHNNRIEYALPPLAALPEIAALAKGAALIFVDCEIQTGMDAFKALALGADGVCIGRPLMTAIRQGGAGAVTAYLNEAVSGLRKAMAFTGCRDLEHMDPTVVRYLPECGGGTGRSGPSGPCARCDRQGAGRAAGMSLPAGAGSRPAALVFLRCQRLTDRLFPGKLPGAHGLLPLYVCGTMLLIPRERRCVMRKRQTISSGILNRMLSVSSLYSYIYCLLASRALLEMPLLGGALYMCSEIGNVFFSSYAGSHRELLPPKARRWHTVMLVTLMAMSVAVAVIYPFRVTSDLLWILFALVLAMLLRDGMGIRLVRSGAAGELKRNGFRLALCLIHLLPALAVLWIFLYNLPQPLAWELAAGYVLCDLLSVYGQLKELREMKTVGGESPLEGRTAEELQTSLERANTFRVYETLSALIAAAVEMTTVLIYTYVVVSGEDLLIQLTMAAGVSFLCRELTEWWLRRRQEKRGKSSEPAYILLLGLLIWFYGLNAFRQALMGRPGLSVLCFCLGVCTAGATLCVTVLDWLERAMVDVARFTAGQEVAGYRALRSASLRLASLVGKMAALVVLVVTVFATDRWKPMLTEEVAASFQPILVVPVLLTVVGAVIFTFRFPLSVNTLHKLSRFLGMQEENPALRRQLESKVVKPHRQPFATQAIKAGVRLLMRHRLIGTEHIRPDDSNPIVFLCNHEEYYGPVISVSYIPVHVRPWSISSIMVGQEAVENYIYKYTFSDNRYVPRPLRRRAAHTVARLSIWCMRQLESIPVYRENPAQLIRTFRDSVEALQTGDNLLIFPENPNAQGQDHGYEYNSLGEFFSGFAMLAPIYYKRTGRLCRFLPMYANKKTRVIAFGNEIIYRPEEDQQTEKERIAAAAREEMLRLMAITRAEDPEKEERANGESLL